MLPIMNNCGLPLCLSGISHPLSLHKEMADHERRRKAMKKMKFEENLQGFYEEIRTHNREASNNGEDVNNATTVVKSDFSCISLPCTAKAA